MFEETEAAGRGGEARRQDVQRRDQRVREGQAVGASEEGVCGDGGGGKG